MAAAHSLFVSMECTGQWVFPQENSSDIVSKVDNVFISSLKVCRKKSVELLEELCLPKGLFPLEEFGYNRASGFIWFIQKKKKEHFFKQIKRDVSYAPEVAAITEKYKLKKLTGVKTKDLLLQLSVVEIYLEKPDSEKLTFKTGTGLSDSFVASAFEL